MRELRGAIFDLDGTIADTLTLCVRAFQAAALPITGRALTDREILDTFGPSEEGSVHKLAPNAPEELLGSYLAHFEAMLREHEGPFAGMRDVLDSLHAKGVRLAVVTGKGPRSAAITLKMYGMEALFDVVEPGSPHEIRKAAAIADVLSLWGFDKDEVVYVGDMPSDVKACKEVGVAIIAAAWASTADRLKLEASQPEWLLDSVDELKAWFETPFSR